MRRAGSRGSNTGRSRRPSRRLALAPARVAEPLADVHRGHARDWAGRPRPRADACLHQHAWDDGYNTIVDVTTDAGRRWWQTSLPGAVLSVTTEGGTVGGLIALVEGPTTDPAGHGASLWSYRTTDGRQWRYLGSLNAVS